MSRSAFGVEHTVISKRKKDKDGTGDGALIGSGGTAAGLGFIGGGVPGMKATKLTVDVSNANLLKKPIVYGQSKRAGIFGYRENAHRTLRDTNDSMNPAKIKGAGIVSEYDRGRITGARAAETKIVGHMRAGKLASNALLVGGLSSAAYGASNKYLDKKRKQRAVVKKSDARNKRDAGLLGGGLFGGAAALGLGNVTGRESKKWLGEAQRDLEGAKRLAPGLGGASVRTNRNGSLRSVRPEVKHEDVKASNLKGVSPAAAQEAGRLRGKGIQAGYFGHVYGSHSRLMNRVVAPVALGVGALGGGGLYMSHRKKKTSEC